MHFYTIFKYILFQATACTYFTGNTCKFVSIPRKVIQRNVLHLIKVMETL